MRMISDSSVIKAANKPTTKKPNLRTKYNQFWKPESVTRNANLTKI